MAFPEQLDRRILEFSQSAASTDPRFKEDWVRSEYIEPLFEALGWRRLNPATLTNHAVGYVREQSQYHGPTTKTPDYSFYVEGRRDLVAEAKKPASVIETDRKSAFQLRRYGFNAVHPVALLTNFAELALYDCRLQPDESDDASVARIAYFRCDDYRSQWDWLTTHLSPSAVTAGNLLRLVSDQRPSRKLKTPDALFLGEIERWREELAESISRNNGHLATGELNHAVQATIDRIVFLRIAEARGLEEENAIERIASVESGLYARLVELFERADTRYNSGLFHFRREPGRDTPDTLTPSLTIDDAVLRRILHRLSSDSSPYDFRVMPTDVLGRAYEQFLGRVISADDKGQIRVEEKPEVRKAGGVFYTPQFVVNFIVRSTLDPLLARKSVKQIEKLRVVDPACGSGSFLIVAYEHLLNWHLERYIKGGTRYRRLLNISSDGRPRLTIEARKSILLNNIFGVDIDPQAVEVAKLSLLLKVIEGETQLAFRVDRLLPDLDENIRCGNSLVGSDFYGSEELLNEAPEALAKVNPFDWAEFEAVDASRGFDAVIGNPPWLMAGYYVADSMPYFRRHYTTCQGKADLYYLFVERACHLVRDHGRIGMIVPNKLFHTKSASALRAMLSDDNWVRSIIDFGTTRVFSAATNYSCILSLQRGSTGPVDVTRATYAFMEQESFSLDRSQLGRDSWNLMEATRERAWANLKRAGTPLGKIATRLGTGVQTGADRLLILSPEAAAEAGLEMDFLRPIFKGRDVRRYRTHDDRNLVVFPYVGDGDDYELVDEEELRERAPRLYGYLSENKQRLAERTWWGKSATELSGSWYGLMYVEDRSTFLAPHILTPALSDRGNFALGTGDLFVTGTAGVTAITLPDDLDVDPLYLLALLNSTPLSHYVIEHSTPYQGGYFKFSKPFLRETPIRLIDRQDAGDVEVHNQLVALASRLTDSYARVSLMAAHEQTLLDRTIRQAEQQVDRLVLELYRVKQSERAELLEGVPGSAR